MTEIKTIQTKNIARPKTALNSSDVSGHDFHTMIILFEISINLGYLPNNSSGTNVNTALITPNAQVQLFCNLLIS